MSDEELLVKIDQALEEIRPGAEQGFPPAVTIQRQLIWCKQFLLRQPKERKPGDFTMGLIATREYDMYGDNTWLANLVNEIQWHMEKKIPRGFSTGGKRSSAPDLSA